MDYKEQIEELRFLSGHVPEQMCDSDGKDPLERAADSIETLLAERDAALRAQQAPAKLNRSRWEGCKECTLPSCGTCVRYNHRNTGDPCTTSCIRYSKHKPVNFCKNCGRPLTEEAWAELERRLG